MHRTTVGGKKKPSKDTRNGEVPLQYHCHNYPPFDAGQYCLFTLSDAVFYPRYGEFETVEDQRQRCRNVHKNADLAVIPTEEWNKVIMIMILLLSMFLCRQLQRLSPLLVFLTSSMLPIPEEET